MKKNSLMKTRLFIAALLLPSLASAEIQSAQTLQTHGRVSRLYGTPLAHGTTPIESAEAFVSEHAADVWGVRADQLLPIGPFQDGRHVIELMHNEATGQPKFFLIAYTPHVSGVAVYDAALKLLIRNEPTFPVVLASAQLPAIEGFSLRQGVRPSNLDATMLRATGMHALDMRGGVQLTGLEPTVFAGTNGMSKKPQLLASFVLESASEKWRVLSNPATGEIIYKENLILHANVQVQVQANVTDGAGADECHEENQQVVPYARVAVGGTAYFAGANGVVTIPNFSGGEVTVQGECRTKWFNVNNSAGSDHVAEVIVEDGGSATLLLNAANDSELTRAEANVVFYAEEVRSFALRYSPDFPTIAEQENFACNVNLSSTCNAYYDGNSINFYSAGGSCNNTGFSTVVHHEYGHHLVNVAGSGQGEYGEGVGDCVGILITGDPRLGVGFYAGDCENGIRNADNTCQFSTDCSSCGSAIHACGQLISGMLWDVREGFIAAGESVDLVNSIFINSIPLHNGSAIDENIVVDWLVLDDDDSTIYNGTPHFAVIDSACAAHGLPAPEVDLLDIRFLDGFPEYVHPTFGASFSVWINEYAGQMADGTQRIEWTVDDGEVLVAPLEFDAGVRWNATLPGAACGSVVGFAIATDLVGGGTERSPEDGSMYSVPVASGFTTVFEDHGESDEGWSVIDACSDGEWTRGVPVGGGDRGDPADDYDGSGACWLTDNVDGNTDVDSGTTTLTSPVLDASAIGTVVSYARWYYNCDGPGAGEEVLTVDVSSDGGDTWTNLEVVGPESDETCGEWFEVSFIVGDFVANTDEFQIRFIAADDNGPQTLVEAAIDAVMLLATECEKGPDLPGDLNGDGNVDGEDVGIFLAQWGMPGGIADINGDGFVDGADFGILIANWTG